MLRGIQSKKLIFPSRHESLTSWEEQVHEDGLEEKLHLLSQQPPALCLAPVSAFTVLPGWLGSCLQVFLNLWRGGFGEMNRAGEGDGGKRRGALAAGAAA